MSTIQLVYGSQTFKNSSTKVHCFVAPTKENARRFPDSVLDKVGTKSRASASTDGYEEHGVWYTSKLASENGVVLMLQASSTRLGASYNNGCVVLALRDDGPLLTVRVKPLPNELAVYSEVPAFVGRADILQRSDFDDYGVFLHNSYIRNHFAEDELEELFDIVMLDHGQQERPQMVTVTTPKGETRKVSIPKEMQRRIRIRKI